MKKNYLAAACLLILLGMAMIATRGHAAFATTVPVSADTATSIARSLFPVSVRAATRNLFLTDPVVIFISDRRIGLQAQFQAYDHRPEEGVAISETGQLVVSGEVGFDPKTRQVLLYEPRIDKLLFDTQSKLTQRLHAEVQAEWKAQVSNPIRAEIPPHPFIAPFKEGIQDITYENRSIFVQVWYP